MPGFLRLGTTVTLSIGPFQQTSDGFTPATGLTIAQTNVRLSKNGAAWAQKGDSSGSPHQEFGNYSVALGVADTGTLGLLKICVTVTGALQVWDQYTVLPVNAYDSLVSGVTVLNVNAATIGDKLGYQLSDVGIGSIFSAIIEGTTTFLQSLRLLNGVLGGKANGLGTSTANFRDLADTKNRVTATVDGVGNRTAVTRDLT